MVCWGRGSEGQIGDGTAEVKMVPTSVPGITGALAARAHIGFHSCAELGNRTVKCWGANDSGQIGDGTNFPRPTPTDVRPR